MNRGGQTRSSRQPTHLLHTPESFVRTALPDIRQGMAIVHASGALGADFLWLSVELEPHGSMEPGTNQRFVYVLEGSVAVSFASAVPAPHTLNPGGFAYLPPESAATLTANGAARLVVIEKPFEQLADAAAPQFIAGDEHAIEGKPLDGDKDLLVRALLPGGFDFDFAVNTMTYAPGASLSQVEIHYMEHGLLMLEGSGTYLLNEAVYEVQRGDFIWMQAYCPQWFQASADGPAKYIIYKDFNRKPRI